MLPILSMQDISRVRGLLRLHHFHDHEPALTSALFPLSDDIRLGDASAIGYDLAPPCDLLADPWETVVATPLD